MDNPFYNGADYDPVISVDGVALPVCPSLYSWEEEDLSDKDAGRSEDGMMHKNRIGKIRKISLEWQNLPIHKMYKILRMFSPEYFTVVYIDPSTDPNHGYRRQEVFYAGNRSIKLKSARLNICERLSFNLISRDPS